MSLTPSLVCGQYRLDLSVPVVMGILNTTPDSFSDGGNYYRGQALDLDAALRRAEQMLAEGARIIDVGGESTRPGARPVGEQEELDRVVPVVERIVRELDAPVSVDTSTPAVMQASSAVGAALINDVRALGRPGALTAAAATGLPVCLMHMQGEPATMQARPDYQDVVAEVKDFFDARLAECEAAGIRRERLLLDPGFGFGKSLQHNLALLRELEQLHSYGLPLLVGLSRKSMLQQLLGRSLGDRLPGSLALALEAVSRGATVVRVHDVAATVDIINVHQALRNNV